MATVVHVGTFGECPADEVYIGRPGPWGNPYSDQASRLIDSEHVCSTREEAIRLYRVWMEARLAAGEPGLPEALSRLQGKRLGCFCAPRSCHGDVLVELAWRYHAALMPKKP